MTPTRQDWKEVKRFLSGFSMSPQEFLAYHPRTTRQQLAELAGCSLSTVNHWFSDSSYQEPTKHHRAMLAIAHWYLVQKAARPALFDEIDEITEDIQN